MVECITRTFDIKREFFLDGRNDYVKDIIHTYSQIDMHTHSNHQHNSDKATVNIGINHIKTTMW